MKFLLPLLCLGASAPNRETKGNHFGLTISGTIISSTHLAIERTEEEGLFVYAIRGETANSFMGNGVSEERFVLDTSEQLAVAYIGNTLDAQTSYAVAGR